MKRVSVFLGIAVTAVVSGAVSAVHALDDRGPVFGTEEIRLREGLTEVYALRLGDAGKLALIGVSGYTGPAYLFEQRSRVDFGPGVLFEEISRGPVEIFDLNHDGLNDVVAFGPGGVSVLLQTSAGELVPSAQSPLPTIQDPVSIEIADVNGDGNADLIVRAQFQRVGYLGDGTGMFGLPTVFESSFVVTNSPNIVFGNVIGDACDEQLVWTGRDIEIWECLPGEAYRKDQTLRFEVSIAGVEPVDIDADGDQDLIGMLLGGLQVFENRSGVFVRWPATDGVGGSQVQSWDVGDYNNDGLYDVMLGTEDGTSVYFGADRAVAESGFIPGPPVPHAFSGTSSQIIEDFDGDGFMDTLSIGERARVNYGGGGVPGSMVSIFQPDERAAYDQAVLHPSLIGGLPTFFVQDQNSVFYRRISLFSDADGGFGVLDQDDGLIRKTHFDSSFRFVQLGFDDIVDWIRLRSTRDGVLAGLDMRQGVGGGDHSLELTNVSSFSSIESWASGDFDGDGDTDVIAAGNRDDYLELYEGRSWMGFLDPVQLPTPAARRVLGAGDFDGDGIDDVVRTLTSNTLEVWWGDPSGTFAERSEVMIDDHPTSGEATGLEIADLDGDGFDDICVPKWHGVTVLYAGPGRAFGDDQFVAVDDYGTVSAVREVKAVDINADGKSELLVRFREGARLLALDLRSEFSIVAKMVLGPSVNTDLVDIDKDGRMELVTFYGQSIQVAQGRSELACVADLYKDGVLNILDIGLFISLFTDQDQESDLDSDGRWTIFDILVFLDLYQAGC